MAEGITNSSDTLNILQKLYSVGSLGYVGRFTNTATGSQTGCFTDSTTPGNFTNYDSGKSN